jgi:hypothetical protein
MRYGDETGAGAGIATLEKQTTSIQQLEDETRAGNGTLEEPKPGPIKGRTSTGQSVNKENTEVCATESFDAGTTEEWRGGNPPTPYRPP